MLLELPRASTLLELRLNKFRSDTCTKLSTYNSSRKRFHVAPLSRKLVPPHPPDITKASFVDLNEFLGPPGWRLEDLLRPGLPKPSLFSVMDDIVITSDTLQHLLNLSGLPPARTPEEKSNLLSALHDQLHFVRHVQSIPTEGIAPLIRVGNEPDPEEDKIGVLSFEECIEESQSDEIPGLEWKPWNVCGLNGGIREGREQGWFIVNDEYLDDGPMARDSIDGIADERYKH